MATVSQLLLKPFSERLEEDKVRIVFAGKPRPILTKFNNKFNATVYDSDLWLTGCEKLQALFCWQCLLFAEEKSQWNTKGLQDFRNFKDYAVRHKKTPSHVESMLNYQLFLHHHGRPVIVEPALVPREDQLMERNRQMGRRIIDVVCYMVTLQYPPQKGTASRQLQVDDCIDILLSLKPYDSHDLTDDAVALLQKDPNLLTELVRAIATVVRVAIKKETKKSTYVSLILNEHSVISSKSQLSTVLRFVKDGKVFERFLAFTDLNQCKTATVIFTHISSVIDMYDLSDRFAAYSCDGAVLAISSHLDKLKASLRESYPYCFFAPCYFHDFDFVLEQSLYHIKECYVFFNNVNSVKRFFQHNSKACEELNVFLSGNVLGLESNQWSNSQFLKVLKDHRRQFIQFFESVVNKPEAWDSEDYVAALALQKILQEFDMIFQLQALAKIFDNTCSLSFTLSSLSSESAFGSEQVECLQRSLEKEKEEVAFENFWISVIAEVLEAQEPKPMSLKKAMEDETKLLYREFYFKIIDCVLFEICARCSCFKDLTFFHILSYEKHGKFVFSEESLQSLMAVHGPYFDEMVLRNEMKVLCGNNSVFTNKSLHGLMEIFISANLRDTFKYLFKLAELTLTMPCKPAAAVSGPCKFDKIRTWANGVENPKISQDLSILCVEEELLTELKESPNFINDVFATLNQKYKTGTVNVMPGAR